MVIEPKEVPEERDEFESIVNIEYMTGKKEIEENINKDNEKPEEKPKSEKNKMRGKTLKNQLKRKKELEKLNIVN